MRAIVTDEVVWSVDRYVTVLSPAKMAEPSEMPFVAWIWVGRWNRVLDGGTRSPRAKGQFWGVKRLHGKWLAKKARSIILLQQNPSFGKTPDQANFSCRRLRWKATKYDVHILWLTVSVYELFECPSYSQLILWRTRFCWLREWILYSRY